MDSYMDTQLTYPQERQKSKIEEKRNHGTLVMPESLIAMTFHYQVVTMDVESLTKISEKTTKEEEQPADEEQPLYIDESNNIIKCGQCKNQFKSSYRSNEIA